MTPRKTVKPSEIGEGYYVAFGSDLGMVGFFRVKFNAIDLHGGQVLRVWGLSRYRGNIGYRTLGMRLSTWLERQPKGVQFRLDHDRSGWRP